MTAAPAASGRVSSRTAFLIHLDRLSLSLEDGTYPAASARLHFVADRAMRDAVHGQLVRLWCERDSGLLEAML